MIIAFYALHYGSDYLGWSIKSIYDFVDKIYILHTEKPSYGHVSNLSNPDNMQKLIASANLFGDPKGKIKWIDGYWSNEVEHRKHVLQATSNDNPDMILTVDSDEIWNTEVLLKSFKEAEASNNRQCRIRMLTLWRSFSWHCLDEMWPIRFTFPKKNGSGCNGVCRGEYERVFHFGYARDLESIRYKISIHGHKGEWRQDWLERFEKWPASGNQDFHPVERNAWTITPYDKTQMPSFMETHPYYNLDLII